VAHYSFEVVVDDTVSHEKYTIVLSKSINLENLKKEVQPRYGRKYANWKDGKPPAIGILGKTMKIDLTCTFRDVSPKIIVLSCEGRDQALHVRNEGWISINTTTTDPFQDIKDKKCYEVDVDKYLTKKPSREIMKYQY